MPSVVPFFLERFSNIWEYLSLLNIREIIINNSCGIHAKHVWNVIANRFLHKCIIIMEKQCENGAFVCIIFSIFSSLILLCSERTGMYGMCRTVGFCRWIALMWKTNAADLENDCVRTWHIFRFELRPWYCVSLFVQLFGGKVYLHTCLRSHWNAKKSVLFFVGLSLPSRIRIALEARKGSKRIEKAPFT